MPKQVQVLTSTVPILFSNTYKLQYLFRGTKKPRLGPGL